MILADYFKIMYQKIKLLLTPDLLPHQGTLSEPVFS